MSQSAAARAVVDVGFPAVVLLLLLAFGTVFCAGQHLQPLARNDSAAQVTFSAARPVDLGVVFRNCHQPQAATIRTR